MKHLVSSCAGAALFIVSGMSVDIGCGSRGASSDASSVDTTALSDVIAGSPDALTQEEEAALQTGLSDADISHIENIDWSQETSAMFLNDPTIAKTIAVLIKKNLVALNQPPVHRLAIGVAHADACSDAIDTAVATGIKAAANNIAGSLLGGGICAALGLAPPLVLGCAAAVIATAVGQAIKEGAIATTGELLACTGIMNNCPDPNVWCAGSCTDLSSDPNNCGGCGQAYACPNTACSNGSCTCAPAGGACSDQVPCCQGTCANTDGGGMLCPG